MDKRINYLRNCYNEIENEFLKYKYKHEPNNKRKRRGLHTRRKLKWVHKPKRADITQLFYFFTAYNETNNL